MGCLGHLPGLRTSMTNGLCTEMCGSREFVLLHIAAESQVGLSQAADSLPPSHVNSFLLRLQFRGVGTATRPMARRCRRC